MMAWIYGYPTIKILRVYLIQGFEIAGRTSRTTTTSSMYLTKQYDQKAVVELFRDPGPKDQLQQGENVSRDSENIRLKVSQPNP